MPGEHHKQKTRGLGNLLMSDGFLFVDSIHPLGNRIFKLVKIVTVVLRQLGELACERRRQGIGKGTLKQFSPQLRHARQRLNFFPFTCLNQHLQRTEEAHKTHLELLGQNARFDEPTLVLIMLEKTILVLSQASSARTGASWLALRGPFA